MTVMIVIIDKNYMHVHIRCQISFIINYKKHSIYHHALSGGILDLDLIVLEKLIVIEAYA